MTVHPTADVGPNAVLGEGTDVWHAAQVMDGAEIGARCTLGKGSFVGTGARIGDDVKLGNYANVFGATVEDAAFIGPHACLLEDPSPRSLNPDGTRQGPGDFRRLPVTVRHGASIGAGALLLPGVTVGAYALVAAGSVVHRDVAAHALVGGNPARALGLVCRCGERLDDASRCVACGLGYTEGPDGIVLAESEMSGR